LFVDRKELALAWMSLDAGYGRVLFAVDEDLNVHAPILRHGSMCISCVYGVYVDLISLFVCAIVTAEMRALLNALVARLMSRDSALVSLLRQQLRDSQERETYWRRRCEIAMDQLLAREGGASPLMSEADASRFETAASALLTGMAMHTMPSRRGGTAEH
jgi:hypothetical protein